jgi:pilus assembly protein CpaE
MPLADILRRSAQEGVAGQSTSESPFAESTKLSLNPFLDLKTGSIKIPGQAVVQAAPAAPPSKAPAQALSPGSGPAGQKTVGEAKVPAAAVTSATKSVGPGKSPSAVASQMTVFFSCKGGAGATALSCNVAHGYSRRSLKTCLVDLDLQLGDTLAALSLQPRTTLARGIEMVTKGEALTSTVLPQHRTGVAVLSQVGSLEDLDKINSEGLGTLIDKLRGPFDRILVDGVRDFSDNVLAVLDKADKIVLVILQEVLAIRRGRWAFGILKKIGFEPADITVVVNRYSSQHQISLDTLRSMFEGSTVLPVARDEGLVLQSLDLGTSLHDLNPRHPLTKNVADIGAHLQGEQVVGDGAAASAGAPVKGLGDRFKFWRKT